MQTKTFHNSEQTYKSVCRICHGGCGVIVHVRDGKVAKVVGDPESPMNKGWMCVKGVMTPDIANHPDRLHNPLRRKGDRGGGEWETISWSDALDEIASKVNKHRLENGPQSIAIGQGTGRHHYMHVVRFANALGTPNWYEPGLAQCFIPRITVSNLTYGGFVVADYYGDVSPKCILFWGHNPLVSGPDGELAISVKRALDNGCKSIAVDPRKSETAKRCEQWLSIRPGTDAALRSTNVFAIRGVFIQCLVFGKVPRKDHMNAIAQLQVVAIVDVARFELFEFLNRLSRIKNHPAGDHAGDARS